MNRLLSGKHSAPWLKITRLSGEPTTNGHLRQRSTTTATATVRNGQQQLGCNRLSGVPDCSVHHRGRRNQQATDVACTRQWIVRCPVRTGLSDAPVDRKLKPTARIVVGAINTPNHHHSMYPSFPLSTLNTRAKNSFQRHIQSFQSSPSPTIKTSDQ
jgi:hypothetical protein